MRAVLSGVLLVVPVLAGCLDQPVFSLPPLEIEDGDHVVDLPIHVVSVGFESFSESHLLANAKTPLPPFKIMRATKTGDLGPEPLQYRIQYKVHEAPEEFAVELFAYAKTVSTKAPPDQFLADYDRLGRYRICSQDSSAALGPQPAWDPAKYARTSDHHGPANCDHIDRIDAGKVEQWIADNRARFGLEFAGPGYTIFILDSYSKGYLPRDGYHQYFIDDGTPNPSLQNMRAWGGNYDFLFLDVGAAPNPYDVVPWGIYTRTQIQLTRIVDLPIWAFDKYDRKTFYQNLGRHVYDATRMLWARNPLYGVEYAERYVLPIYLLVEPQTHGNPSGIVSKVRSANLEQQTDAKLVRSAIQSLVPWAEVEVDVQARYLPDDDPDLWQALQDAKSRSRASAVDYGVVRKYLDENWDRYVPTVPGARVYPTFALFTEYPTMGRLAFADSDKIGNAWGSIINIADMALCLRPEQMICFPEDDFGGEKTWVQVWNSALVHELGHNFGLTHPHDTGGLDASKFITYERNWLWTSTASVMSYRNSLTTFSTFDKEWLWRNQATALALRVLDRPSAPDESRALAERALQEIQRGEDWAAIELARAAFHAERLAFEPEFLGTPGTPTTTLVRLPMGRAPLGQVPEQIEIPLFPSLPLPVRGVNFDDVSFEIPEGASAMEIEYREVDWPTHAHWSAEAWVVNKTGVLVTVLDYNAHDKLVLLDFKRCETGCRVRVTAYSGVNLAYEVTVRPYFA